MHGSSRPRPPARRPANAPLQDNDAIKAGLSRYVKKKKLERIDTYIAPLLEAKGQLVRVGRVMREAPPTQSCTPAVLDAPRCLRCPASCTCKPLRTGLPDVCERP
jgi:hypothetical protein